MAEKVALVTYSELPELAPDDRLLVAELERRGASTEAVVWDAPDVDWRAYDAVVVRSCWDYYHRRDEFLAWVDRLEALGVPLWNPPAVLRWNSEKTYLRELADRGVAVVPTRWIDPRSAATLAELLDEAGWDEVVVKPAVSAAGFETWRTSRSRAAADEDRFRSLRAGRLLMLQPFVPEVATAGEWSLIFLAGRFSHAVLKRPRAGDFRVQPVYGGTTVPVSPDDALIAQACSALAAAPAACLYGRVDGCVLDGRLHVMELEVLEPSLFLDLDPGAAGRLADAIRALMPHPAALPG